MRQLIIFVCSFLSKIVAPDTYINPQYNVEVIRSVLTGSPTGPDALLEFVVFSLKDIITVGIDVVHDIIMPLSETISTTEQFCLVHFSSRSILFSVYIN